MNDSGYSGPHDKSTTDFHENCFSQAIVPLRILPVGGNSHTAAPYATLPHDGFPEP